MQTEITNCKDTSCEICYESDEDWTNYVDDERPMTNHSFDDEGFLR